MREEQITITKPIISIIVPVYNVEKYLEKCVDSILTQTFTFFELILVDDGSTDNSGNICDKLVQTDPRLKVIHKQNGGLSSARNAGIDIAQGEYLGFIDSDDYIERDMYQLLYDNMIRENADMSMCGIYDCYFGKRPLKWPDYYNVINAKEAIKLVMEGRVATISAVNKLYKRHLFHKLRYPMGKQAEDAFMIVDLLLRCSKVVVSSEQKYYYFHRENSITTGSFRIKDYDIIEAYKKNYQLIIDHYPELEETARMRLCWAHFFVLDRMAMSEQKKISGEKAVTRFLKNNALFILNCDVFTVTRKIAFLILLINWRLYRGTVRNYINMKKKKNK